MQLVDIPTGVVTRFNMGAGSLFAILCIHIAYDGVWYTFYDHLSKTDAFLRNYVVSNVGHLFEESLMLVNFNVWSATNASSKWAL